MPRQKPRKIIYEQEGQILLARNPHPPVATLRPELRQAIVNPLDEVRAGAVEVLARLLRCDDPAQAVAARQALERLTKDASQRVSEAAGRALGRPEEGARKGAGEAVWRAQAEVSQDLLETQQALEADEGAAREKVWQAAVADQQLEQEVKQELRLAAQKAAEAESHRKQEEEAVAAQKAFDTEGWVTIPAGEFLYGFEKEQRYLPAFQIRRTPVTNAEYAEFIKATGHAAPMHWPDGQMPSELAQHPVVWVSWDDAQD
jgi:hypothetical protein